MSTLARQWQGICTAREVYACTFPTSTARHAGCMKSSPLHKRHSRKRSTSLRTTTDLEAETSIRYPEEAYNWFKHWWPVQFVCNLDDDRPNRIQLLGEYFVAWKSKNEEWVVMKDMCPHRLAPLSEGKSMIVSCG